MTPPVSIHGELLLPARVLEGTTPDQVEAWLKTAGVVPLSAEDLRWRMDPLRYGFVLSYDVTVTLWEKEHTA